MSVKVFLFKKKESPDGPHALTIRITKDRRSSYIYIGHKLDESQWDSKNQQVKKSHPNSKRLNNLLIQKLAEASDRLLEMETKKKGISSKKVKEGLKSVSGNTFFKQAEIYLGNLKQNGNYNSYNAEVPRVVHFRDFLKGEDISFEDITPTLLQRYQSYLRDKRKIKQKGKADKDISERTVVNHLIIIRTVFNRAIKDHLVDAKYYPFGHDGIKIRFPDSTKLGLTAEEIKKLEELELESGSQLSHARNLWLFSFYFAGVRVSDVLRLKWSDFQDDRLHYMMGKNAKGGSLKIPDKALKILHIYKGREAKHDLVFPELEVMDSLNNKYEVQRKISYAVKQLDKYLKRVAVVAGIEKKVTMHIARHSFGNISGDRIPVQMLQKLYRHSSITTTIGYQRNFIHKDADEALDAVVGF